MNVRFSLTAIAVAVVLIAGTSDGSAQSLPEMRMTPSEIQADAAGTNQIGSSGLQGVHTKVVFGNPSQEGFYSILLFVPAHTTIQAHSHRDNRVAVVVSGSWHLGYGNDFAAKLLKALPPGSVYSEPGGDNHFARTDNEPVVVEISGYGPTDTRYYDAANDPRSPEERR